MRCHFTPQEIKLAIGRFGGQAHWFWQSPQEASFPAARHAPARRNRASESIFGGGTRRSQGAPAIKGLRPLRRLLSQCVYPSYNIYKKKVAAEAYFQRVSVLLIPEQPFLFLRASNCRSGENTKVRIVEFCGNELRRYMICAARTTLSPQAKKTPGVAKERARRCRRGALLCERVQFERACRLERTGVRDQ